MHAFELKNQFPNYKTLESDSEIQETERESKVKISPQHHSFPVHMLKGLHQTGARICSRVLLKSNQVSSFKRERREGNRRRIQYRDAKWKRSKENSPHLILLYLPTALQRKKRSHGDRHAVIHAGDCSRPAVEYPTTWEQMGRGQYGHWGLPVAPQGQEKIWGRSPNRGVDPNSPHLSAMGGTSQAGHHGEQLSQQRSREEYSSSLDVSPNVANNRASDRIRAHLSFAKSNDGDRERSKSLPYSAPPTYRTTSNDRSSDTHGARPFSISPSYIDSEGSPVSSRPQTFRAHPHLTFPSKQTLLFSRIERPFHSGRPGESHMPSSPLSPCDRLDFPKSQSLPRGTTLRSTSWGKHSVLGDGGSNSMSPLSPTTTNSEFNSSAPTSLISPRPLYHSHPLNTTRDAHSTPNSPAQIVKKQKPIVSSTHTPASPLQTSKTVHNLTSLTTTQSLTRFQSPTPYIRPPPPGERRFPSSLISSLVMGRSAVQGAGRESLKPGHSEDTNRGLSQSHSPLTSTDPSGLLSQTRPRRIVEGPTIFSSLRSGSLTSPRSPPTPRTTRLQVWRTDSMYDLSGASDAAVNAEGTAPLHGSRFTFDRTEMDSVGLGTQRKTAAPLSLPDFGSYCKPRFSSAPYASLKSSRPDKTSPQGTLSTPTSPQRYPCYNHSRTRSQGGSNVFADNSEPSSEDNVEVLVYRISKVDSSPIFDSIRPAQHNWPGHTQDTQVVTEIKSNELSCPPSDTSRLSPHSQAIGRPSCLLYQRSNGGDQGDSEADISKTESFPKTVVAPLQTQSLKKGFFSQRNKRDSGASLLRTSAMPPSEEPKPGGQKGSNRMDLVLSRLRQTFRVKRPDDERRKRTTPSFCDSETSNVSDVTKVSNSDKRAEKSNKGRRKDESVSNPPNSTGNQAKFDMVEKVCNEHSQLKRFKDNNESKNSDQPGIDLHQIESHKDQNITDSENQTYPSEISPTRRQFEDYKREHVRRARNQAPQIEISPTRCPNWDPSCSATLGYRRSSASPRNSSVFQSSPEDPDNDNVFHSPRLLQRSKTTSLCVPRDRGFGSCADLKYGLEAGRSISVSAVMSNRRSGPGRISTGPRVFSLSDLTDPTLTYKDDWKMSTSYSKTDHRTTSDSQTPGSNSKSRHVSWSSEVISPSPTRSGHMLNPSSSENSPFTWDLAGPPTPPPSPPGTPAFKHTYRSLSSSLGSPSPSDRRASPDSLSPRGHLPSRGYISSLAAFNELDGGSDRDSDSTTDDEYYLAGDGVKASVLTWTQEKKKIKYPMESSASSSCRMENPLAGDDQVELDGQQQIYHGAARVIQRTWRRHMDIGVFRYFKNLVKFCSLGDPRHLLKTVNPNEADILDAAAGVHVRFRLGGTSFPPYIYYKIYTHRPIVDICASSPKDYTHAGQKRPTAGQTHNQQPLVQDYQAGWYRRVENNGWRRLSGKTALQGDIITLETNGKKASFHHSKLHRRQDVERRKKRRKIEWLKQMYDLGCLIANTEHSETAVLVEKSARGMMDAVEKLGTAHILEWEVDELLEWTNALNFDEYIHEWKNVGTSKSSESCKANRLVPSTLEPMGTFSGLGSDDRQVGTYSAVIHPLVSSLVKSEHCKVNLSD
ncbi:hypothetical protein DPEC_G00079530 [Dallia pectoralis]|uniref:Uncharacterized protein n=1 Tax=Dallia pectoralis TaxID=75939 RepID=A0ACC2H4M6_DALPE|nr:hypothetical protein DPEC_G00079530 [Dallia pectoralis]